MTQSNMEQFALWGENPFSKNIVDIENINDYVVLSVPRATFRTAGMRFTDIRRTQESARYDEITMQLFLKMIHMTGNKTVSEIKDDKIDVFPYVSAYLEWVPSENKCDNAVVYRIHAFSFHPKVNFGTALAKLIGECGSMHRESNSRSSNSRKVDPVAGITEWQAWKKLSGMEMYVRTVCDRYTGTQEFTAQLDDITNPSKNLNDSTNPANPSNVFSLKNALKLTPQNAKDAFSDITIYSANADGTSFEFVDHDYVQHLTMDQVNPKIFCSKYLPDYQKWMNKQKVIPAKMHTDGYDQNCETEYDVRSATDLEKARLAGMLDRSAFSGLAKQSAARYDRSVAPHSSISSWTMAYKMHQEWCVKALNSQCLDPDACISEVVSKMVAWREKQPTATKIVKHRIRDASLSAFANRVITLMEGFEQYYLMSTAHRMMYLIHHARYDAFRRDFGLHMNMFQAGESATSKSFTFDVMVKSSIPGTTEVLSYQTGKSDAVDGNRNDITSICHEAPPGMFRTAKNPNADSSQETMFKEKLTSQRVTCKTWCMDESTGRRSARVTNSECIGVWMGATNDPKADVEEALRSRFFWGNFEQQSRRGRNITDCMAGARMMSTEDKAHRKKLFQESKEEQYRVMLVEKAIWVGLVKDVNTTASNILIPRLTSKMMQNSIVRDGPRDWLRVKLLARNQAIVNAIEVVCNLPGGKWYGTAFDTYMIPDLEPYLRVTEEMVIFSISMLADQFKSPVEHKILNVISKMEIKRASFVSKDQTEDPNYVKLDKMAQLCSNVNSGMSQVGGKTSVNNIHSFFKDMCKHTSWVTVYKFQPGDDLPTPTQETRKLVSCINNGQDGVYIHYSHIVAHKTDNPDSAFDRLASETHRYSNKKRILTAAPINSKWFHVFKVIEREPGTEVLHYSNVLANSKASRWMTGTVEENALSRTMDGFDVKQDIDEYVAQKWSKKLCKVTLTPSQVVQQSVLAELDEETFDIVRPESYRYPCDYVKQENVVKKNKAKKKKRALNTDDAINTDTTASKKQKT